MKVAVPDDNAGRAIRRMVRQYALTHRDKHAEQIFAHARRLPIARHAARFVAQPFCFGLGCCKILGNPAESRATRKSRSFEHARHADDRHCYRGTASKSQYCSR